jgi:hypothetical protein
MITCYVTNIQQLMRPVARESTEDWEMYNFSVQVSVKAIEQNSKRLSHSAWGRAKMLITPTKIKSPMNIKEAFMAGANVPTPSPLTGSLKSE